MSFGVKVAPDGSSATIQIAGVDRLTIASDGSVTATTSPATGDDSKRLATTEHVKAGYVSVDHGATNVGALIFARQLSGSNSSPGTVLAGSSLSASNGDGSNTGATLIGNWRCLGYTNMSGASGDKVTMWQRVS